MRVVFVLQEPTPYRTPHLAAVAEHPELDVTIVYAARTIQRRSWSTPETEAVYLRGPVLPLTRLLHHDYAITPGVWRALNRLRPDVVVIGGWSVMATQLAILWCRTHRVPYLLMADNTLLDERPAWVRTLKRVVLRHVVPAAAGYLVPGTLAADHLLHYGARSEQLRTFPLTIDVAAFGERVADARGRRHEIRAGYGISDAEVVVLHAGRLIEQKGVDVLLRAAARAPVHVLIAGDGPQEASLRRLARDLGMQASFAGMLTDDDLVDAYAAADIFALASRRETWGVVVNEAAAAGLPLVLSDRVGAAADLLQPDGNGVLVPVGDERALTAALTLLAGDGELRARFGARSAELIARWGYEPSVESLTQLLAEVGA